MPYVKINKIAPFLLSCLMTLLAGGMVMGQQIPQAEVREDFTDEELEKFVQTNGSVNEIYAESEKRMISTIEDEGLTVDRFNEIVAQMQDPQREVEASEEEIASMNNAAQVIMKEREQVQAKVTKTITDNGLEVEEYQQIVVAYQQSPAIKQKIDAMMDSDQ